MASRRIVWMLFLFGWPSLSWSQEPVEPPPERPLMMFLIHQFDSGLIDQDRGAADQAPLIRLIQRFIAPDSWEAAGGQGRIVGIGASLLVYGNPQAHREISNFMMVLRRAQRMSRQSRGANTMTLNAEQGLTAFSQGDHQPEDPVAKVYPLDDLPKEITFITDRDLANPAVGKRSLLALLKSATPVDSWEEQGGVGSIIHLPIANFAIIIQTEPQHKQISNLLAVLRTNRDLIGLVNPNDFRIVDYSLIGSDSVLLSAEKLRDVAARIKDELKNLGWNTEDQFIIVDDDLTISQKIEGQQMVQRKFAEWGYAWTTDLHRGAILENLERKEADPTTSGN